MMALSEGLRALPADLRQQPGAAAFLSVAIVCLAALPVVSYGGNIVAVGATALGGLAGLTKADRIMEGSR